MSRKIGAGLMQMQDYARKTGLSHVRDTDVFRARYVAPGSVAHEPSLLKAATKPPEAVPELAKSPAPDHSAWRMSTARWLEANVSVILLGGGRSAPERIALAIERSGWMKASTPDEKAGVARVIENWTQREHVQLTAYLSEKRTATAAPSEKKTEILKMEGADEAIEISENKESWPFSVNSERSVSRAGMDDGSSLEDAVQYGGNFAGSW